MSGNKERKLECGDKARTTTAQAQQPVYCKKDGYQKVVKKDQKK